MATIFWKVTASANWNTADDWNTDTIPGSGDDAVLGVTGFAISDAYTVSVTTAIDADSILISDTGAVLAVVSPGTLTVATYLTNDGDVEMQYGVSMTVMGDFTNDSLVNLDTQTNYGLNPAGGSTLTIGGTLTNSSVINIGDGGLTSETEVSAAALANTGTINLTGNTGAGDTQQAVLDIAAAAPTTWMGTVSLAGQALLEFASGSIGTIAQGAEIYLATDQGYIADAGTLAGNSALTGLTDIAGNFNLEYGATVDLSGNLDVVGSLDVDTTSDYADNPSGGSTLAIAGTLTNSGGIYIGNAFFGTGGDTATSTISAAALVNTGTIVLFGNSSAGDTKQAVLDIAAAAPTIWTGSLSMYGQALLEYGSGSIGTIAQGAEIYLATDQGTIADAGTTTANSALTGLAEIDGDFELQYGPSVSLSGGLTVTGTLNVDTQTDYGDDPSGGSTLTIAGTLVNSGSINIGNGQLTGATTVSAAALVNTGSITIDGNYTPATLAQAALDIVSAAPTIWSGYLALNGQALLEYGSGSIGTIASGALIYLSTSDGYIADAGTPTSNSALSGLSEIDGGFNLEFGATVAVTGNLNVIGYLDVDTTSNYGDNPSGGSNLVVGGTLTNSSGIYIGNAFFGYGGDTATSTISAAALVNTGTIVLYGNSGTGDTKQAVLDIAAAAPTIWQGQLTLDGQALMEFGSGSIGTIAAGAAIDLDSGQGFIADAGTTTANSALTGLTEIDGDFELQYGPSVSLSGGLTVTGTLNVDTQTDYGDDPSGGSTLTIAGTLVNSGSINIGNGQLTGATTVSAAALVNTGSITIDGNYNPAIRAPATLDIGSAAPTTWTGDLSLNGEGLLEYGSGSIGTIAAGAEIYLSTGDGYIADAGTLTSNSALSGLSEIDGGFNLEFGATVAVTGNLDVIGYLDVDTTSNYGDNPSGGSNLVVGGTLTNSSGIYIGNAFFGYGGDTATSTISAAALVNTGTIVLYGNSGTGDTKQAVLDIAAAAPTIWQGHLALDGQALMEFGSGSIGTIAAGAAIDLDTGQGFIADAGTTTANSALTGLTEIDGYLELQSAPPVSLSGSLTVTDTGTLNVDTQYGTGGSTLTIAGTLTNSGSVSIGNYGLSAATIFTASSIDNQSGARLDATGGNSNTVTLTVTTVLTNAGSIGFGNDVNLRAAGLSNSGNFGISGNYGQPSDLNVVGTAANSGTMTIGPYAMAGVTGAFTDSGILGVGGVLDTAGGLEVTGTGSLVMQGGSVITPDAATLTLDTGASVSGNGTLALGIANSGTVTASGGVLDLAGTVTGDGGLAIAAGSALEIGAATSETVGFGGDVGTLKLDQPANFTGAITGLVENDTIDLVGVKATSAVVSGGTLTVTAGSQTYTYQVSGPGLATNSFALEDDQQGGTDLVLGPPGPVISGPLAQTAFLGFPSLFGPVTITDPNAGAGLLTVTITAGSGVLAGTPANAGTLSGNGSNKLVLTGDLADINTMLAGIAYLGASAGAVDDVQVVVTDAGSATAAQTIAVTTDTVPFTLPVLNTPLASVIIPGVATGIAGISVSDPYAQTNSVPVTVSFTASGIAETLAASGTGGTVTGQDSGNLSITGTLQSTNSYFSDGITNLILADAVAKAQADAEKAGEEYKDIVGTFNFFNTFIGEGLFAAVADVAKDDFKEALGVPEPPDLGETLVKIDVGFYSFTANVLNDVAAIAGGATSLPPPAGSSGGPGARLITFDGLLYQLDATGQFILAQSTQPGDSFAVQIQLQPVSGSASASEITAIAAQVGSMRVTFAVGRAGFVWVNGTPSGVGPGSPVQLGGGELTQPGPETYVITWNTGETLTVVDDGSYLDLSVSLGANNNAGTVQGLLGTDSGQASDFTMPGGTVLPQPLTSSQLYGFASDWQVTAQNTLFDSATTFAAPAASVTLVDLPANIVALAATAVGASGITNAAAAAAAEFDFIASGGDPAAIAADAGAFQGVDATAASITPSGTAPTVLGIFAPISGVPAAQSGPTEITFDVYLTAAEATATQIDYAVIAPNADDLDAAEFGGILPTGVISIAAGQTTGTITIDVPQGALGSLPSADVDVQISTPGSVPIFAPRAVQAVNSPQATAPTLSELAVPLLEYLGDFGTFSQSGNDYTLNLGQVSFGEKLPDLLFGIANAATGSADALGGTISWSTVEGFDVSVDGNTASGFTLPSSIAAGSSVQALTVATVQDKFGAQAETITFDPVDTNSSGYSSSLAPITLTISDTLQVPGTITSNAYGDVHILTYNGLQYNFQAAGEFVLAESEVPGDTFQIQLRLQPYTESSSVTLIQQVAILLGTGEDVTFGVGADGQPPIVLVNGGATSLSMADPTLVLSGGTITEVSPDLYKVMWNTGESMTVDETDLFQGFNFFNVSDSVPYAAEGSVMGLQGENEGTQNDFQLPDGTVLQQPLTSAQLLGEYADAWRVTESSSLFYYGPGQSFQTFAHPDFPTDPLTLADVPASVVAQAAALVAAAGITDPVTAANAELDYIVTGDPNVIAADLNVQQQVTNTVAASITPSTPPVTAIGVMAAQTSIVAASSGATAVTFTAYLTAAASTGTVVDYAVVDPNTGDLGPSAFSGILPSGSVTIAAGQTTMQFTIDVPQGALGTAPDENLEVQVSSPADAVPVLAPSAMTEIVNAQPEAGNPADPVLAYLGTVGTFTFDAQTNTYTLDLGGAAQNAVQIAAEFAVINAASVPSDELGGTFTAPSGTGFTITGDELTTPLAAGAAYQGLYATVNTAALGPNGMSLTFDPVDQNASGYTSALTPLKLDIVDDITPPAQGALNTPATIIFPNAHVGATDSEFVSVTNSAASGSASLDVSVDASGSATASGSVSQLAAGMTNASAIAAGIDTSTAGALNGEVSVFFVSDQGGGNTAPTPTEDPNIDVFGDVYRLAAPSVTPNGLDVHIGASGAQSLTIANTDPDDGYSENLVATVVGTTGAVTATGTTGEIGAQKSGTIAVDFSTATAGPIGTVTLDLKSDGTGIDGLGVTDLGDVTVPVSVTGNSYADPEITSANGTLVEVSPGNYTLDLGDVTQGAAPVAVSLSALNAALAPADDLGGSYTISGDPDFTNTGFAAFSGVGAGAAAGGNSVALDTGTPGGFSETIALDPTDSNAQGFSETLPDQTVTVTGTVVQPTGTAIGDVHLTTFDGLYYDFQASGLYTLAQSTVAGDSFNVQIKLIPNWVIQATSVINAVAATMGDNDVTFGMGPNTVLVNGQVDTALSLAHPTQILDGGTLQMLGADEYEMTWSTGESILVTRGTQFLDVTATLGPKDAPGSVQGLLGSDTGQANDFALADGTVLPQPISDATLMGAFASSWSVPWGLSLLNGTVPGALGSASGMTFIAADAPGQVLTGSLSVDGTTASGVAMIGTLANLASDAITNFTAQDVIDVTDLPSALATLAYSGSATQGVLTIGTGGASAALSITGNLSGGVFHLASDQHGGTLIALG